MLDELDRIKGELSEAACDPLGWGKALDSINAFAGGSGVVLLSVDERLRHAPASADLSEMMDDYFSNGWHARDCREGCRSLLQKKGIAFDHEFQNIRLVEKGGFHNDFLARHDRKWFVGLGASYEDDLWCFALQRSAEKGPFEFSEAPRLLALRDLLSQTALLAGAMSHSWLKGASDAYARVGVATVFLDRKGRVLDANRPAHLLVDAYLDREGFIRLADRRYARALEFYQRSVSARLATRFELLIKDRIYEVEATVVTHVPALMISGASMMLIFKPLKGDMASVLQQRYGLTPSEAKIAVALAAGAGVADIARSSKLSTNTVRSHLKSAYAKTDTGSQSKIVSLILRLKASL